MKWLLLCALLVGGCGGRELQGIGCFEHVVEYRRESNVLCMSERDATDQLLFVADVAQVEPDTLAGWYVLFLEDESFFVEGIEAAGSTNLQSHRFKVANVDYRDAVLRHEFFHGFLWEIDGDPDAEHTDDRWALVN